MTKTFTVTTDANGYYHMTDAFSPPGPFGFRVDIFATFTSPPNFHANGSVTLDGPGNPPQSKSFVAETGQRISLGTWSIAHGNNTIIVQGSTDPKLANTSITVDVEADLSGF